MSPGIENLQCPQHFKLGPSMAPIPPALGKPPYGQPLLFVEYHLELLEMSWSTCRM